MADVRYCPKCGTENAASALFCENCGVPLRTETAEHDKREYAAYEDTGAFVTEAAARKKSFIIPVIIIVLLALAGAGVFAYFHFFQKTELDLTRDLDADILTIEGYDGEGYISGINTEMARERWGYESADDNVKKFLEKVEIMTDKENDAELSNGDAVKIMVKYNKADAEEFDIKVTGDEKTVVVRGLQKPSAEVRPDNTENDAGPELIGYEPTASSTLDPEPPYSYEPDNLCDGNAKTAWSEGADDAAGEYVELILPETQDVSGIMITNGYCKSEDIYEKNDRPNKITIDFDDGATESFSLGDIYNETQRLNFSEPHYCSKIRITIDSVYEGTKWSDATISEIKVF